MIVKKIISNVRFKGKMFLFIKIHLLIIVSKVIIGLVIHFS